MRGRTVSGICKFGSDLLSGAVTLTAENTLHELLLLIGRQILEHRQLVGGRGLRNRRQGNEQKSGQKQNG